LTRVAVVSVARSDYSILRPVLKAIVANPSLTLDIIASGMHLSPEYGLTVRQIEADGFKVTHRVEMLMSSDTATGTAKSMGVGMIGFSDVYANHRPDLLMVMGDRFEMFAATAAALPHHIPVAHIHGGELTEGAIDDAMRHAITKMSHVHFVSTEGHRDRVIQLGEDPKRVFVSGAPALDNLNGFSPLPRAELERRFGLDLSTPPLLVTFHPVTLELDRTENDITVLLQALRHVGCPMIFTAPNADPSGRMIRFLVEKFCAESDAAWFVENLGTDGFYSLLHYASAMVGNSSSGIIEAASFRLPVVNIGNRQKNRLAAENVLHVPPERTAIAAAIERATSREFRSGLKELRNPYGDGLAATRIVEAICALPLDASLIIKRFHDLQQTKVQ
jgi:UDP-hydrolysing UDP-N-acetyl-D-glucosamine 2-epimerase